MYHFATTEHGTADEGVTEKGICFFQVPQDPVEITSADPASYMN